MRALLWLLVPVLALTASLAVLSTTERGREATARWRERAERLVTGSTPGGSTPTTTASPSTSPSELPSPATPSGAAATAALTADSARIRAVLAKRLGMKVLGPHVVAAVAPLDGGDAAFSMGTNPVTPASTMKLLTATAALEVLGPDHVFTTAVVTDAPGRITLVGGGDPYLASKPAPAGTYPVRADLRTLAGKAADALRAAGTTRVRLDYDAGLFVGPALNPNWPSSYVPENVVSPTSALWVDEGHQPDGFGRVADPALTAATTFAGALRKQGIVVRGVPRSRPAPASATALAEVSSAPLAEIAAHVLEVSDNDAAEVLARHVGIGAGQPGSIDGARTGIALTLSKLGVPLEGTELYDGSGLSRDDRLTSATLLDVLQTAASPDQPHLRAVISGLPVAGFTGSLQWRFVDAPPKSRGLIRAKTGTLTGVHGLAGVATDRNGTDFAFVLIADQVAEDQALAARAALDRAASALGACVCSR